MYLFLAESPKFFTIPLKIAPLFGDEAALQYARCGKSRELGEMFPEGQEADACGRPSVGAGGDDLSQGWRKMNPDENDFHPDFFVISEILLTFVSNTLFELLWLILLMLRLLCAIAVCFLAKDAWSSTPSILSYSWMTCLSKSTPWEQVTGSVGTETNKPRIKKTK